MTVHGQNRPADRLSAHDADPGAHGGLSTAAPLLAGLYYSPGGSISNLNPNTVDTLRLAGPFIVPTTVTAVRIGLEVTTAAAGGSTIRLGIYRDTDGDGKPNLLVVDAGTIDSTTTGYKELTISQQLTPGRYWFAAVAHGADTAVKSLTGFHNAAVGVGVPANDAGRVGWAYPSVPGTLPNLLTAATLSTTYSVPRVFIRA